MNLFDLFKLKKEAAIENLLGFIGNSRKVGDVQVTYRSIEIERIDLIFLTLLKPSNYASRKWRRNAKKF